MQPSELQAALAGLAAKSEHRERAVVESPQGVELMIDGRQYVSFASNDYLGLANHPAVLQAIRHGLDQWGAGSASSPLLVGHFAVHQQLEHALAAYVDCPATLLFSSGYAANLSVISSLLGRDDAVFADRMIHASLNDSCLLSRADFHRFRHNDLEHLQALLQKSHARSKMIVVDSVYSMNGDEAPLVDLLAIAEHYDAWLYIDDAHGFGFLGQGRGCLMEFSLQSDRIIYMATLGKSAGVAGAFVAASRLVIDWLVNSARSYLFSTSKPPALAQGILTSLALMQSEPWRRARLQESIAQVSQLSQHYGINLMPSRTPIQPILIGPNDQALRLYEKLRERGIWVPAIRPPAVPAGSSRLRISLSAAHRSEHITELFELLSTF